MKRGVTRAACPRVHQCAHEHMCSDQAELSRAELAGSSTQWGLQLMTCICHVEESKPPVADLAKPWARRMTNLGHNNCSLSSSLPCTALQNQFRLFCTATIPSAPCTQLPPVLLSLSTEQHVWRFEDRSCSPCLLCTGPATRRSLQFQLRRR